MDYYQKSLKVHRDKRGKIEVISKLPVTNREELSVAYTPGVAEASRAIAADHALARELTATKNMVAVITDGSAVLGLGDIGPEAALPVMEGKAVLFKTFAGIDAFPIVVGTQDVDEFINTVKNIALTFGGINLEDISAPRCFEIEERLKKELPIPVFHDDQHGTAIVVLAGLINALKVVDKRKEEVKIVLSGAGAAGIAITNLLRDWGAANMTVCDSKGIIGGEREDINEYKRGLLEFTNKENVSGTLQDALRGADVFIGVSAPGLLGVKDIKTMNKDAIVFAMANPIAEVMPEEAKEGGASVIATGRSDYPNQLNNVLAFPGIFKGAFEAGVTDITDEMQLVAAQALAGVVEKPTAEKIIPDPFDKRVVPAVAGAVRA
ncbi:MAG: NADP-dependent malic enzyme [Candidatus Andersenbacteria bacterium]|nr:NADP-dependent malic enzyme [bacterium]MDZ4225398.1 NADP-dependent malic enzyme [Candidatus Andersenbacteria bacterium]